MQEFGEFKLSDKAATAETGLAVLVMDLLYVLRSLGTRDLI